MDATRPKPAAVLRADQIAEQGSNAPGRWAMAALGMIFVLLFVVGLKVKVTSTTTMKTQIPHTETVVMKKEPPMGSTPERTTTEITKINPYTHHHARSSVKTEASSLYPEGILLALLGLGAGLLLVSALYARLTVIKLPGGAEIDLTPEEKAEVAKETAKSAAGLTPIEAALATVLALDAAREKKAISGGRLQRNSIAHAVSESLVIAKDAAE